MRELDALPVPRFPMRFLTLVVVLTGIVLVWLGWGAYQSYQITKLARHRNFKIEQLRGTIVHLDEVLTMSARMAAATGEPRWEQRHRQYEPKLDAAIKEAIALAPEAGGSAVAAQTDQANLKLVEMEHRAFALIGQDRLAEARAILFSDEYETQKETYAEGMRQFADLLATSTDATLRIQQQRALLNIGFVVGVIAVLLAVWVAVLRAVRRWRETLLRDVGELKQAEEALRKAHDELDLRVRRRTAQLAGKNEELQRERYLLGALMGHLPLNIYFKDAESRFIRINRAMADYFGLGDPAEAVQKSDFDFFSEEHARQARGDEELLLRPGAEAFDKEEKETWPDGHVTWVATTKMPLYDEEGGIVGTFGVSRDITEQKQSEEALRTSEMKFRTLYNSSRDAIMMLTPEEGFFSGNPAAVRLFGCRDEQQFTCCTPADLSPEYQPDGIPSSEKAQQMMATAMQAGSHFFEWRHRRIGAEEFAATVLLTRMELEGKTVLQATVRDVTKERRAAEALRKAKDAAEAANRAKSVFLANVSHEIRTPMNAIMGMTELMFDSSLSRQQQEYLDVVRESGDALLLVINDILDFSKIEAGKLSLDRVVFNLSESLGDTMKSLAIRAHERGLELAFHVHHEAPNVLLGDAARLRQIILNLVGNAVKFTEAGEVVLEVHCESLEQQDVVLHFTVTDTGIGIPPNKLDAIFGMFEQVDASTTRRYRGTGLGLAIVSRLVELMDGRIWAESRLGHGSTFHFTARFAVADEPPPARRAQASAIHGMRVLVVDDNATNRRILDEVLRSWHMRPDEAPSADDALRLLGEAHRSGEPYTLVLSDVHMPGADGFTLAERIKQDAALGSTVIMMLTSGGCPEDISRCEQLGIASYLMKPVKQSELFDAIMLAIGIAAEAVVVPAVDEPANRLPPLRVLLAEDSLVNQKLAVALLENHGHQVVVANNGREALAASHSGQFDLVLMDVQMPEMDGLESTAAIRAREKQDGGHVPIIAMTAHALKGDRERCLQAGMDEYVAKPIQARVLFDTIRTVLGVAAPGHDDPPAAPREPGTLDLAGALRAVGGKTRLLRIVAEASLEEVPRQLEAIRSAIAEQDAHALKLAAHTLKGAVRYFGAEGAFDSAFELERMGKEDRLEDTESSLAALQQRVARLLPALEDFLRESDLLNKSKE